MNGKRIEEDTPMLPYMIASVTVERLFIDLSHIQGYTDQELNAQYDPLVSYLEEKAQKEYQSGQLELTPDEKGRDKLYLLMNQWALKYLKIKWFKP